MKYIIIVRDLGRGTLVAYPILFPNMLVHADVAKNMLRGELRGCKVDSAGFLSCIDHTCYGRSESLNIDSKPERDSNIIQMLDYGGQFML